MYFLTKYILITYERFYVTALSIKSRRDEAVPEMRLTYIKSDTIQYFIHLDLIIARPSYIKLLYIQMSVIFKV